MRKTLNVFFVFVLTILTASAQKNQYPSLLWQISGNGLQKPSYLFGTMHVSQKMAFHLGEPWFKAIDSVDVVAMETSPDGWLKDLLGSDLMRSSFDMAAEMATGKMVDMDKERYAIGKDRPSIVVGALRDDPAVINSIMYRYTNHMGDYEEDSWLDMYLYQTGKKMGKQATGLESFEESMTSLKDASVPDEDADEDYTKYYNKYLKQAEIAAQIQTAYRNGNLDLLDSLSRKASSKNMQKHLIVERNARFVNRMDSIMKTKSLFTGVGAAHLPGEEGVIAMLRKLGYTVTPITMGERDAERRNRMDSMMVDVVFKKVVTSDSIVSVNVPGEMYQLYSIGMLKTDVATELINGAYYSLSRIKTYSSLVDGNTDVTWKMVDSLLYDNVPGKILEQKEVLVNGYKALDIVTRARKGNIIRMRIILLPEELLVLKASAPEEKVMGFLGDNFLNSVSINLQAGDSWQRFTLPDKRMSVQFPAKPVFYGASRLATMISKTDLVAHDAKTRNDYIALVVKQKELDYFEEDTFELSRISNLLAEANGYTEKKRSLVTFKNRKALKVQYQLADKRLLDAMVVLQNLNYYIFGVYYTKPSADINRFFESVELGLPEYKEFFPLVDSTVYFTTKTCGKPKSDISAALLSMGLRGFNKNTFNKDEVISESKNYTDNEAKESIQVALFKYSKYYKFEDEATFIKTAKYYITNYNDFEIKEEKLTRYADGLQLDFLMTDTNSTKVQRCMILLKNSAKYVVTASIDPQLGQSDFVKTFFAEFKPVDSITGGNLFADKSALFFADIKSGDTARIEFAKANVGDLKIGANYKNELMAVFSQLPKIKDATYFKISLYKAFEKIPEKDVIEFLKKEYDKAGDTADYQITILRTLAGMKTAEAALAFKDLLLKEPPLGSNVESNLFSSFEDSTGLVKEFFPDMFQLLSYDEFKDDIYSLLSMAVIAQNVKSDVYKDKLNLILSGAKTQLKHVLSDVDEEDNYRGYLFTTKLDVYNTLLLPFKDQENVKAHFDKIWACENSSIKFDLVSAMLDMKMVVPANAIAQLAADDEFRIDIYELLKKNKMEALFPAEQKTNDLFLKSLMADISYSVNKDSVFLLEKRKIDLRGKKGLVYFYKYKNKDSKGDSYNLAVVGLIPEDPTQVITSFSFKSGFVGSKIDKDEKLDKQLNDLLAKTIRENRRNNYFNYDLIDMSEQEYTYMYSDEYD
jgi:uncharacterized protein YbaP (TraB family)